MEYPMICFNYGRCEPDGTYSERTKYGMIGVIIHEVGHNFFPMIINSDERQWTWMDEGLNTFVQFLTEKEFDRTTPRAVERPQDSGLHGRGQDADQPHHDELGVDLPVWKQRLRQAGHCAQHPARDGDGAGVV